MLILRCRKANRTLPLSFMTTMIILSIATAIPAQITQHTIQVGDSLAAGCQNAAVPPTLTGGTLASATLHYVYDASTAILELTVTNTSPVTLGVPNPVITEIFVNLPYKAVSNVALIAQIGASGPNPNFGLAYDTDLLTLPNPLHANCFGAFGLALTKPQGGPAGGIGNANADTLPGSPNSVVIGPVTFTFQISGPSAGDLQAGAFAHVYSIGGIATTAALKFQGGGPGGAESGTLSASLDCRTAAWYSGEPRIGNVLEFFMSNRPGCYGCLVISASPGPLDLGSGVIVPVGDPWYDILSGVFIPPESFKSRLIPIPNDPVLINVTFYFAVATIDPNNVSLENAVLGDGFSITILP